GRPRRGWCCWPLSTGKRSTFPSAPCAGPWWNQGPLARRCALPGGARRGRWQPWCPWARKGVGAAMKVLGAVLLVASGLLAGLAGAARLKRRARLLLDLKTMLQAFQTGIRYAAESLAGLVLENQASRFCRLAERDSQFLSDPAGALERAGRALLQ